MTKGGGNMAKGIKVIHLLKELDFSGIEVKELSQKYNLAPSIIYNIKKNHDHYLIGESRRKIIEIDSEDYKLIYKLIEEYFKSWLKPINI